VQYILYNTTRSTKTVYCTCHTKKSPGTLLYHYTVFPYGPERVRRICTAKKREAQNCIADRLVSQVSCLPAFSLRGNLIYATGLKYCSANFFGNFLTV
jgi:hypothetical protein